MAADKAWLQRPKLRPVEVIPVRTPHGEVLALRDPGRLAPEMVFLSPAAVALLSLFDGQNDLRDIQAAVMRAYGQLIELDAILGLTRTLDEKYFLEGDTFNQYRVEETRAFAALAVRPASLAGQAYPADPVDLRAFLDHFPCSGPVPETSPPPSNGPPSGLVAPHIDFARGGPCYQAAFNQLNGQNPPDLCVILGVAHAPTQGYLALLAKDMDTPFGPARADRDLMNRIVNLNLPSLHVDELVHRGEHSAEFMAVWLMSRLADRPSFQVLPFLCGSFHRLVEEESAPEEDPLFVQTLDGLAELLDRERTAGRRVMILAGADLSHVGPQFGDAFQVTRDVADDIRTRDLDLLDRITAGDFTGFYQRVMGNQDRTHICGLSALYILSRLLGGPMGRRLAYDQWIDPQEQGLVSFASLVFD
jgi:AmmeMemoRadiSam system protein B